MSGVHPPAAGRLRPPRAHSNWGHARATVLVLVVMVFLTGVAYPVVVTEIAHYIDPGAAAGSLVYHRGTLVGSSLVAQNLSRPYLFWARPSPTDYNLLNGSPSPPGPGDPSLYNQTLSLINETKMYMGEYGNATVNGSVPFWLASYSASSVDPDLVPDAVLIQVPRVANATNLSIAFLQTFVNNHIVNPWLPYLGVPYVDVLELDLDLLTILGK